MCYVQKAAIAALLLKCIEDIKALDSTATVHMESDTVVFGFAGELNEHVLVSELALHSVPVDVEFADNIVRHLDKVNVEYKTWA